MSLTFLTFARCGLCGYVCKGMGSYGDCRVNKHTIRAGLGIVVAPFCRECDFPMTGAVRTVLDAASTVKVRAYRARKGWALA